jgi:4-hydroxy-tetrahydrodipicolinate reductase
VIRVAVAGAAGRMGQTVCAAVEGAGDMELVARADPALGSSVAEALAARPDVLVDFTTPDTAVANVREAVAGGVHVVIGTTGFDPAELDGLQGANVIVAPNFAIGAVLMMRLAELVAPFFDTAEVIEMHHDNKVDAPSGTAMLTAQRMAAASGEWGADPTKTYVVDDARGGIGPGGIRMHSLRLRGVVAHHEVLLGTTGQSLSIRHDSYDRTSYMPGVLLAIRRVREQPGLTVGLDALLDL